MVESELYISFPSFSSFLAPSLRLPLELCFIHSDPHTTLTSSSFFLSSPLQDKHRNPPPSHQIRAPTTLTSLPEELLEIILSFTKLTKHEQSQLCRISFRLLELISPDLYKLVLLQDPQPTTRFVLPRVSRVLRLSVPTPSLKRLAHALSGVYRSLNPTTPPAGSPRSSSLVPFFCRIKTRTTSPRPRSSLSLPTF